MKKGGSLLFICVLFSTFLILGVYAQEGTSTDISTIDPDAELEVAGGVTPDSPLYFIDKFFDNFADKVKVRQEAVAEIRTMIEEGKYDRALEALEFYKRYAEEFEREVFPEQRDEARRSAAAIYNVLKSLEAQIPDEYKADFDEVIEHEEGIVTAAEIAGKIKALCEELSELDPLQYSRVCKTGVDSPRWQQKLHRDLTEEQRQEAEEFFEIMSQCFETSGETCRCEDISIAPFAEKCSRVAPLAYACGVEANEDACNRMGEIEEEEPIEDLLPDYLRDVLRAVERKFEDNRFENYAPRECREAGATTRVECEKIMFKLNAPPECVEALERGEISIDNLRDAREACERIMFQNNVPPECLDEGLTDFRECGRFMFELNAPQECLDAGLTGEHRGDERKCALIMREGGGPGGFGPPTLGIRCREIQNSEERLDCYDLALAGAKFEHFGNLETPEEHEFPEPCQEAGAFTIESCGQVMMEFFESQQQVPIEQPTFPDIQPPECGEGEYIECIENECRCVTADTATISPPDTTITDTITTTTGTITSEPPPSNTSGTTGAV